MTKILISTKLTNPIRQTRVLKLVFITIPCLKFWAQSFPVEKKMLKKMLILIFMNVNHFLLKKNSRISVNIKTMKA